MYCQHNDCYEQADPNEVFCFNHKPDVDLKALPTSGNMMLARLLQWLDDNDIELEDPNIFRHERTLHVNIKFDKESAHDLRQIKRALGGLTAIGLAPYVGLEGRVNLDGMSIRIAISGAYECRYTCEAKRPGVMPELSDGVLSDTIEQEI